MSDAEKVFNFDDKTIEEVRKNMARVKAAWEKTTNLIYKAMSRLTISDVGGPAGLVESIDAINLVSSLVSDIARGVDDLGAKKDGK